MVLLLLTKLINGLVNAYRAPSGTSFRGRLMLLVLRLLFNKDYLERNKDEAVYLRIAEERSAGLPTPPVPPSSVHIHETRAYDHLIPAGQRWKIFHITPSSASSTSSTKQATDLKDRPFVLYLHGGGYVATALPTHFNMLYRLAEETQCEILVPCYPRPPHDRVTHREVIGVLLELMRELRGSRRIRDSSGSPRQETTIHSRTSDHFVMYGDSAGGGLIMAIVLELARLDLHSFMPTQVILNCPWLDVELKNPEAETQDRLDPFLSITNLRHCGRLWAGADGDTSTMHLVNPGFASDELLRKLKLGKTRFSIFAGTCDVLYPQDRDFARRLESHGIPSTFVSGKGMAHAYLLFPRFIPEVDRDVKLVNAIVKG